MLSQFINGFETEGVICPLPMAIRYTQDPKYQIHPFVVTLTTFIQSMKFLEFPIFTHV